MGAMVVVSSLLFTLWGYLIFIKGVFFDLNTIDFYGITLISLVLYLAIQGFGMLFRRQDSTMLFMLDIFVSFLPLFLVLFSYYEVGGLVRPLEFFREAYLLTTLVDIFLFTMIANRFSILTNKYSID